MNKWAREFWWRCRYAWVWYWVWSTLDEWSIRLAIDAAWAGDYFDDMTPREAVEEELSYWTE